MRAFVPVLLLSACQPLALTAVSPAVAAGNTEIEVRGTGFDAALELEVVGEAGTFAMSVVSVDGEEARVRVPGSAPGGVYDVVARSGGSEARLVDALTIRNGQLELFFFKADDGDATLVIFPGGTTILIDGGPRGTAGRIVRLLDESISGRLDGVILTHADDNHLGGFIGVLQGEDATPGTDDDRVPAVRLVGHGGSCPSAICEEFSTLRATPFAQAAAGTVLELGGATLTVVAADGVVGDERVDGADDADERSMVMLLEYAGRSVLLAGDVTGGGAGTADIESRVAEVVGSVDVLHLSGHGSEVSSSAAYLQALQPRAVVLSVGTNSASCLPSQAVIDRIVEIKAPLFATGDGVVDAAACGAPTVWPEGARHGLGTITTAISPQGDITIVDQRL